MKKLNSFNRHFESFDTTAATSKVNSEILDVQIQKADFADMSISFEYATNTGKIYAIDIFPERKCLLLFSEEQQYWLDKDISIYRPLIYRLEPDERIGSDLYNFIQHTVNAVMWSYDSWMANR